MTAYNLLQGAADGLASCTLASSSIVCRGSWDVGIGQSHPVRPTERITSEMPTLVQDSAESRATRHLDSPTDGGLEYLMPGNPQWPSLNHSLQFKHRLSPPHTEHSRWTTHLLNLG